MPSGLKRGLAEEVRRTGRSLNDVAVGILASRFAVSFEPSGRPGKAPGEGASVLLRMPAELKDRLAARAAQRKRNVNDLIVETLSERTRKGTRSTPMERRRGSEDKVRVALIGVGNCANSLLQGVEYYKDAPHDEFVPRPHAREPRGLPRERHRVRRRVRRLPRTRSARISPTRSGRIRTTRSSSRRYRRPASKSVAA